MDDARAPMDPARLFTWLFVASEATFFAFLVVAYVYFHTFTAVAGEPTARSSLDPVKTGVFSIFLFSSSLTFWLGERALARKSSRGLAGWMALTLVLGGVFLIGQGLEYAHLIRNGVTVSRNVFGSSFFTLTGLHGLHVGMGLLCILVLLILATRSELSAPSSSAVESVGIYWHFVDAVWVVLFCIIYLGVYL